MKKLIVAFLALTLLSSPSRADEADPQAQVMMDIVRMIVQQAREGRLEQLIPHQEQLRGLEGVLRPDGDNGYAPAEEVYRVVKPTPQQEQAMRGFRLSQEQMFAMLDFMLDHGAATRPQDLDQFLTRDQQMVMDNLQLSSQQMEALQQLLSQQIVPMMERLQGRVGDVGQGVQLTGPQSDLFQMLLQLIPPSAPRE